MRLSCTVECRRVHTKDEVVLCDLAVTDLLGQGVGAVVDVSIKTESGEFVSYFGSILFL